MGDSSDVARGIGNVDVTKAAAEVRSRELENLRYAARINANLLADPEIQTMVVAPDGTQISVPAGPASGNS